MDDLVALPTNRFSVLNCSQYPILQVSDEPRLSQQADTGALLRTTGSPCAIDVNRRSKWCQSIPISMSSRDPAIVTRPTSAKMSGPGYITFHQSRWLGSALARL